MKTIAKQDNGDILIQNGKFVFLEGPEAIAQNLKSLFRTFQGEIAYDTTKGIPWYETAFIRAPDLAVMEAVLATKSLGVDGVEFVSEVSIERDSVDIHQLKIIVNALTEDGLLEFSEQFNAGI